MMSKNSKQSRTNLLKQNSNSKSKSSQEQEDMELHFDDVNDYDDRHNSLTNASKGWTNQSSNRMFNANQSTINNNNNSSKTNSSNINNTIKNNNQSTSKLNNQANETTNFVNNTNDASNNNNGNNGGNNNNAKVKNYNNYRSNMEFYRLKLSKSKLKAVTRTSALLSGFAMVAMVELGLDYSDYFEAFKEADRQNMLASARYASSTNSNLESIGNLTNQTTRASQFIVTNPISYYSNVDMANNKYIIPESILVLYALVTCLLVGVHMLALMISTCILPQIEASSVEYFDFEQNMQMLRNDTSYMSQQPNPHHRQSVNLNASNNMNVNMSPTSQNTARTHYVDSEFIFPYRKFHRFIELAWVSSTVLGIFLFLVEIGLVCYIKFYPISFYAALTGALVMIPICVVFVIFTFTFYKRLADFKLNITKQFYNQINRIQEPLHDNIL